MLTPSFYGENCMHVPQAPSRPSEPTRLALDGYLLLDPLTQRVRFTRSGQVALAQRFARCGITLSQLRTVEDVETAIARVIHAEYARLSPAEQDDDTVTDTIEDLHFIVDGITGRPLLPLEERRERRSQGMAKLFALLGIPEGQ